MNVIVAVNADWGIGFGGKQPIVLPEDRKFFRERTTGGVIIAGRNTFEDFPGVLPERKNIILTRDKSFKADGATVLHAIEEVLSEIAGTDPSKVFVVGGGNIYSQFLPLCKTAYVTKIEAAPQSDTYFPNLDILPSWALVHVGERKESAEGNMKYSLSVYRHV
ncbi:MAG: dihydrofolate reductase [Oscillospiraceae bacterium]|nr:dihydrofolate reductase [Oscillospiraceae bacterium]